NVGDLSGERAGHRKHHGHRKQGNPEQRDHAEGNENTRHSKDNPRMATRQGLIGVRDRYRSRTAGPRPARMLPTRKIDPATHATRERPHVAWSALLASA